MATSERKTADGRDGRVGKLWMDEREEMGKKADKRVGAE